MQTQTLDQILADVPLQHRITFGKLLDTARWKAIAPNLHVGDAETCAQVSKALAWEPDALTRVNTGLIEEGYFQLPPPAWDLPLAEIAEAISVITSIGDLPVFAYMYDEVWLLFARLKNMLSAVLGDDYRVQPAFWAWHIGGRALNGQPSGGQAGTGWKPHRDQDCETLRPDRTPKALSVWIPLTDATPTNGCMYILPADRDPNYLKVTKDISLDLQDIRALPSPAGGVLGWTQAALHWGAGANPRATAPRISVSVEFQRGDEAPYKAGLISPGEILPPAERLKLILRQIVHYQHFVEVAPEMRKFASEVVLPPKPADLLTL